METGQATVHKDGITRFNTVYVASELAYHIDRRVNIRWDRDDLARLLVYDPETGDKVCEAVSHELMGMADRVSQDDLTEIMKQRNTQKREVRGRLAEMREAHTFKCDRTDATPEVVGALELDKQPPQQVVSLPNDKEYRRESIRNARGAGTSQQGRRKHLPENLNDGNSVWNRIIGNAAQG